MSTPAPKSDTPSEQEMQIIARWRGDAARAWWNDLSDEDRTKFATFEASELFKLGYISAKIYEQKRQPEDPQSPTPLTDACRADIRTNNEMGLLNLARKLERENAALREDAARIDWLEKYLMGVSALTMPDMGGLRFVGQTRNPAKDRGDAGPSWIRVEGRTLRQTIDSGRCK